LYATPIFGSQQEEGKESHEEQVAKELWRKPYARKGNPHEGSIKPFKLSTFNML